MDANTAGAPERPALLDYLPYLWSRVVFGGHNHESTPVRFAWLWLVILPGLLLYPCLSFHLFEPDEGRYAEIPREMLARGDAVVPYLLGEPYLDKPPLFYWLVMTSFRLLGAHVWTARLVPALAVHGCVLVTYLLGRRLIGPRGAFWGALLLALAPGFVAMGRLLILDGPLALCVTIALLAGYEALRGARLERRWWLLSAIACGSGVLTKGPIALILVIPPLVLERRLRAGSVSDGPRANDSVAYASGSSLRWRDFALFGMIVAAIALPWFVAICVREPRFGPYFLWEHNVIRFLSPFDHIRPIWFYLPILAVGLLPGSLLLIPLVRFLLTGDPEAASRRSPEMGFLLLAGGWCVLFFSLSGCKLPTYILPAFPMLTLALGSYVAQRAGSASHASGSLQNVGECSSVAHASGSLQKWLHGASLAGAFIALAVINYGVVPWYARFHSPLSRPDEVRRYCSDATVPIVCYPRNCDSMAFFLGRDDLRSYRSKQTPTLVEFLQQQQRTVVVFTHRHSLEGLRRVLPPQLILKDELPISGSWRSFARPEMCYMAVVERR